MPAIRIFRRLRDLLDVTFGTPADGDVVTYDTGTDSFILAAVTGGGAPSGPAGGVLGGTYPDPDFAVDMATQAELDSAVAALSTVYQPLDSDLTAIAALTTTSFGRAVLALADAAALRTAAGLGTAATSNTGDFDAAGAAAAAQAASQPLDSDLTAIAALTTTSFGRAFLALADAAAGRTALGLVIGTDVEAHDSDLTTIGGLSPANDDVLQRKSGAWANRTIAQLITDLAAGGLRGESRDQMARTARGIISETWPFTSSVGTATAFGGTGVNSTLSGTLVGLRAGDVITNLLCFNVAAGSSVSLFKLGIWKTDGTFLGATADIKAQLGTNVFISGAINGGAITIPTDGGYYIGGLTIASSGSPTFLRSTSQTGGSAALGAGSRPYFVVASQTDITGNVTPAAATTVFWFACN